MKKHGDMTIWIWVI